MVPRSIIRGITTAAFLLACVPVHADATLIVQGSDGFQSMIQLRDGKGRMSAAGRDEYIIYDTAGGTVTYVEPQARRYTQLNKDELEAGVQTAASMQQAIEPYMARMLAAMPPEQRRMIEQSMGTALGPPAAGQGKDSSLKTVARGKHTIAGLSCQATGILKQGRPAAEVCMVTAANGKLSTRDFATLEAIVMDSRDLAFGAKQMLGELAGQLEYLSAGIKGVPIALRDLQNDRRFQVTAVSNTVLSDDLFNGYDRFERREMPALLR